jgi:exodeoxyribonuclease V alpha subunit
MAITTTVSSTEVLAGLVDRVTFHNSENGFCVLRVKARGQRDLITLVGHAAMISAGEFVQASGTWFNDRTHGVQFKASFLKATAPTTVEGIEKYLGSGMIRGIGSTRRSWYGPSAKPYSTSSSRSPIACAK